MKNISFLNDDREMVIIRDVEFLSDGNEVIVQQRLQSRLDKDNVHSTEDRLRLKAPFTLKVVEDFYNFLEQEHNGEGDFVADFSNKNFAEHKEVLEGFRQDDLSDLAFELTDAKPHHIAHDIKSLDF